MGLAEWLYLGAYVCAGASVALGVLALLIGKGVI